MVSLLHYLHKVNWDVFPLHLFSKRLHLRLLLFLPVKIQNIFLQEEFLLRLTGLISLLSKGLSRVFSNTTIWKHQFFSSQPSVLSNSTSIRDYWKNHSFNSTDLSWQSDVSATLSRFAQFFFQGESVLILWLQSPSTVILGSKKIKSATVSTFSTSICHEVMGLDTMILVFWMLNFMPTFSLSSRGFLLILNFLP